MAKVQQISEIAPSFAFTEYDFYKDYEESFKKSELGRIHSILPLREMAVRFGLRDSHPHKKAGRKSYFSPEGKVALMFLKAYTGLSAPKLMEQLNANIHYQLFCGIRICSNRIVSVNKPYVRPIVRGKEIKKVEFGAKSNNIQVDGISFIEKLSFNAFNEGTRLVHSVILAEKLFREKITRLGGDSSYSGNENRSFCSGRGIETSFSQKGRKRESTTSVSTIKKELARVRATAMEGAFGTQKEHYGLKRINGRIKKTEILIIFFGIHTANAVLLAKRAAEAELSIAA